MPTSPPNLTAVVMADASHSSFEPLVDCGPNSIPFALMPFANRPLIETLLETLRRNFCNLAYIVCSPRCAAPVERYIRNVAPRWRNIELKFLSYGDAPTAAATLRALNEKNQLPDKFVFVPIESVFASLILPDMMAAHNRNEKECGAVLTIGMNNTAPGMLKATYDHLQRKAALRKAAAAAAAASSMGSDSDHNADGGSHHHHHHHHHHASSSSAAQQNASGSAQNKAGSANDNDGTGFTIPHSDGDGYDGDLWSIAFEPGKGNCVKQFASWREAENDNLKAFDRHSSTRSQLLSSALSGYAIKCTVSGDIRVLSDVEFTGICVCSSVLVTEVVQRNGSLQSMNEVCRCIIDSAEVSDATFSAHVFSTPSSAAVGGGDGTASGAAADAPNFNSLMCSLTQPLTGASASLLCGGGANNSHQRSAFVEMSFGGFHTPPMQPTAAAAATATGQQSNKQAGGGGGGIGSGTASAFATADALNIGPSAASAASSLASPTGAASNKAGAASSKPKKLALPGAPKIQLPGGPIGGIGGDVPAAMTPQAAAVKVLAGGNVPPAQRTVSIAPQASPSHEAAHGSSSSSGTTNNNDLSFFNVCSNTQRFVPIYSLRTFSSLIRAHVATASRQLLSLSMVMPSYTSFRGHPSVFVNIEGAGARGVAIAANIGPNVIIGSDCKVPETAILQNCTLGDGVELKDGVVIRDSVLHDHVTVEANANIRHSVIGHHARIEAGVKIKRCFIGAQATVELSPPPRSRLVPPAFFPLMVTNNTTNITNTTTSSNKASVQPGAVDFFRTEFGTRNFSALDHGIETDVTLLFAKVNDANGGGGNNDFDDDIHADRRERLFRMIRPHVERAIEQGSPREQLQVTLWRRMLIDLDDYNLEDLVECIARALIQIVGRKFSHKLGTLPAMTPTSRRSGLTGAGGGGGGGFLGGGEAQHQREFDAADREHAVTYLAETVLDAWVPSLFMQLLRYGQPELETDQTGVIDGLCRGVGSSEGEIFADGDACQKILRRFMRFNVLPRKFLDEHKRKMDEELEAQRERHQAARMAEVSTPTEENTASDRPPAGGSFDTMATESSRSTMPNNNNNNNMRDNSADRSDFEDEDPLYVGWTYFEQAISNAVPMEHGASYANLGAFGGLRARSLESLGTVESTPRSNVAAVAFPTAAATSTGVSPSDSNKQQQQKKTSSSSTKKQSSTKKEPEKKKRPAFLAGDTSSSSSSSSSDGDDEDDDAEDNGEEDEEERVSGETSTVDTTSLQASARRPAGATTAGGGGAGGGGGSASYNGRGSSVGTSSAPDASPWDSKQTTPPVHTPVTQQQASSAAHKAAQQEEAAAAEKAKAKPWFLARDSSSDDDDDEDLSSDESE